MSRGVSTEPAPPATVDIRVNTGVFSPTSVSTLAIVYCLRGCQFKKAMRAGCPCMDNTLGDTLMIKMRDFIAENKILQQRGAVRIGSERVLIIRNLYALVCSKRGV